MAQVAIDCRFAGTHSGLGRYTRELTTHLTARGGADYTLLVRSGSETWLKEIDARIIETPIPHYSLAEQRLLPGIIRETGAALLLSPHFNVPLHCPIPTVVTIHDLILHRYPNNASLLKRLAYRYVLQCAVRQAAAVIAVSPFVGSEVSSTYPSAVRKIRVIEEGVSLHFFPRDERACDEVMKRHGIVPPFFLYVGNAKQHRNVLMLLSAFKRLPAGSSLLLVTGGPEAAGLDLPAGARLLADVSEHDLPALYSAATACVTASLYEGFCLPLVEALACGCPVVAPRRSAIPDVVREGPCVRLIEPTEEALFAALRSPPGDRTPQRPWRWDDTARKTEELLLSLL